VVGGRLPLALHRLLLQHLQLDAWTRVDDGMTTSPTSSLQDLSENVSCSSDRIHHPSISSGPPHLLHLRPPPRSVSSGSLSSYDESDLDSCSSLEVDIHEIRSQWRNSSERDRLPLKPFQPFNDLSPSPPSHLFPTTSTPPPTPPRPSMTSLSSVSSRPPHLLSPPIPQILMATNIVSGSSIDPDEYCNNDSDDNINVDVVRGSKNPTTTNQPCINPEDGEKDSIELLANEASSLDTEDAEKDLSEALTSESIHSCSDPEQESTCEEEDLISPPDTPLSPPLSTTALQTLNLRTLTLNQEDPAEDNRLKSTPESPIVDAYEKECLDQPEKMVKELETQAKEGNVSENEDQDNQVREEEVHSSETEKEEDSSDKDEEKEENIAKETPVVNEIENEGVDEAQVNEVEEKVTDVKEIEETGFEDVENLINKIEENGTFVDREEDNESQVIRNNQENESLVNGVLETQNIAEAQASDNQENENQENENQTPEVPDPFVPYRRGRRERDARRRRAAAAAASPSGSPCLSPARKVPVSPSRERTRPNRVTFEEGLSWREGGAARRRTAGGLGNRHFRRSVPQASSSSTSVSTRGRITSPDAVISPLPSLPPPRVYV
ncbi:hypothetical protein Pcinc_042428, partial [Petrolisthes cinctipes]